MTNQGHARSEAPVLVSIGLPVFDGGLYLRQTLESMLRQTWADFELLIADNASADSTEAICREYARADSRICYVRNPHNIGAAANYNKVFSMARGKYFKWLSHDDIHAPRHLESCIQILEAEPEVVLCYPKSRIIDSRGDVIRDYDDGLDLREDAPHRRLRGFLRKPAGCNPVFGVMRAEVLATTSLIRAYDSSDHNLLAEMCLRGKFQEIPERLFYRRCHPKMSRVAHRDRRELARWFDPAYRGRNAVPRLRLLCELLRSILRAPLSRREIALCVAEIPRAAVPLTVRAVLWSRTRSRGGTVFDRSRHTV